MLTLKIHPKNSEQTSAFLGDFEKVTSQSPLACNERIWDESVAVNLCVFNGRIHISSIESMHPGKGKASELLRWITDCADRCGVEIDASIKPFGEGGLSAQALQSWYERYGFEILEGGKILRQPADRQAKMQVNPSL